MRPRSFRALLPLTLCLLVAGCGNEKNAQSPEPLELSSDTKEHSFPAFGLTLELPSNLNLSTTEAPGVFRGAFGDAVVSGFAYRRAERLPRNQKELDKARERLVRASKERDPGYRLRESRTTEVAGARAVELVGEQTISRGRLRIRSLHVYDGKAEYVIELLAPPADFARLDKSIFDVVRRTLEVTGEVRRRKS